MILRPYQRIAINRTWAALRRKPVLVAPTGSGKTVMAATLVRELGVRTLWVAHRRELIHQAADQRRAMGLRVGIILAGVEPDPAAPVQVGSVQTLNRRTIPSADLIVIDEAHHVAADSYANVIAASQNAWLMGMTATLFRLDGRGLGDIFEELVVAATTLELCDAGVLHAPTVYTPNSPNLRGIRKVAGDYSPAGLAAAVDTPSIIGYIVTTWKRLAAGRRTVAFAVNVEHSRHIVEQFRAGGVMAEHLDGSTPVAEQDAVLDRLRRGTTAVVSNCQVLTEGWDLPSLECAIIARPTASLCLHQQAVGRIMRSCEGKAGVIVLDHAGNHLRHGFVTDSIGCSLDGTVTSSTASASEPPLKSCRECDALQPAGTKVCPECGTPFPRQSVPVEESGELIAVGPRAPFAVRLRFWQHLQEVQAERGFKPGWAMHQFNDRFGAWPCLVEGQLIDPHRATTDDKRVVHSRLESIRRQRGYQAGWVAHKFRETFGVWPRGMVNST